MITIIILKEIREHLFNYRFWLTFLVTAAMMTVSALVFIGKYQQNLNDFNENVNQNNTQLGEASGRLCDVAFKEQLLQIKSSPMQLIAEGGLKHLPNSFLVNTFKIGEPETINRSNKLIPNFADIDWTFVISLILSFFALLLVYDAVCGEKSQKTLSLVQSNPVSRTSVILGKYLGAMITLLLPLLFSMLLSLLIVVISGNITFSFVMVVQIGLFFVAALLYLSVFVLIGLFVSSRTTNPVTSIMCLLLVWTMLVILIPNSGGVIASKLFSIPTFQEIQQQIQDKQSEISQAHIQRYERTFYWNGDPWAEWVPYRSRAVNDLDDATNRITADYLYQMIRQVEKSRNLTYISPAVVFSSLSEHIADTGIYRFTNFYGQLTQYSQQLEAYILDRDSEDPDSPHLLNSWHKNTISMKPVDSSGIPRFLEADVPLERIFQSIIVKIGILVFFNIVFFSMAYVAYLRYDVR